MVVVLPEHKLIYIEEPRAATRSTHTWLMEQLGGVRPWEEQGDVFLVKERHASPRQLKEWVEADALPAVAFLKGHWNEYQFFIFTHNPFHMLVTYYIVSRDRCGPGDRIDAERARRAKDFTEFLQLLVTEVPGLLTEAPLLERLNGCDHAHRFEDGYPAVLFRLLKALGVPLTEEQEAAFPRVGKTPNKEEWTSYYTSEAEKLVRSIYPEYIRRCGYACQRC